MSADPLAAAAMVAYCGWDPTTPVINGVVELNGNGTRSLLLPSLYVTAVSAVTLTWPDGSTYSAQIGAGLDVGWDEGGELEWLPSSLVANCWPEGKRNVAVTYSGGYDLVPDDLNAALASLSSRTSKSGGVTSAKIGTGSLTYSAAVAAGGLLTVEQWVFDRYRIPRAA